MEGMGFRGFRIDQGSEIIRGVIETDVLILSHVRCSEGCWGDIGVVVGCFVRWHWFVDSADGELWESRERGVVRYDCFDLYWRLVS